MTSSVITTEQLGKCYRIQHRAREPYQTLRDSLVQGLGRLFRPSQSNKRDEVFWALRDIDLQIAEGERVGIIGHNGAGKSTLLKLLSRITQPSTGRIGLRGRVASLLEIGTGFHVELTGRENIYLNGAVLGMNRRAIDRRFDEIVDFSGVENFLDTPVKRYSSGMQTRLAFAVSAHLEPDIMLVDEVLAVGDAAFQKKCLDKMEGIAETGRTVLFVSHNMNAVEQFCDRVILLEEGQVVEDSRDVRACIRSYLAGGSSTSEPSWERQDSRFDNPVFSPLSFHIADANGKREGPFIGNDEDVNVVVELELMQLDPAFCVGYALYSADGELYYWTYQTDTQQEEWPILQPGFNRLYAPFPRHLLNEGEYRLQMIASLHFRAWQLKPGQNAPAFDITVQGGLSQSPYWQGARPGLVAPVIEWRQDLVR